MNFGNKNKQHRIDRQKFNDIVNHGDNIKLDGQIDKIYARSVNILDRRDRLVSRMQRLAGATAVSAAAGLVYATEWAPASQPGAQFGATIVSISGIMVSIGLYAGADYVAHHSPEGLEPNTESS